MHTEPAGNFPISLRPDQRNRVRVACFGSAELLAIDLDSYQASERYELDGQPLDPVIHPVRGLAQVALPRKNAVAGMDLETGAIQRRIRGCIEPDGLRWGR